MSNQRNVDALLCVIVDSGVPIGTCMDDAPESVKELAAFLTARGVLVPSALTSEECREVSIASQDGYGEWDSSLAPDVREALERIAKGDQP